MVSQHNEFIQEYLYLEDVELIQEKQFQEKDTEEDTVKRGTIVIDLM